MRNILFLLLLLLFGCRRDKGLDVFIENSSDLKKQIMVESYLDGKLINKRQVNHSGEGRYSWESFRISLPNDKDEFTMNFKLSGTSYTSECRFSRKQIKDKTWMHVNLNEVLFKKGDRISGMTLDKDSIMKTDFYCELVN